jgi:hypothetical protein
MGWLSFAIWIGLGLTVAFIAYWLAAGRSKAAKVWAEIASLDPALGPFSIVAILFTKKTKPDA